MSFTYAPELDSNPRFLPNPKIGVGAFQDEQKTVGFILGNDVDMKLAPRRRPPRRRRRPPRRPRPPLPRPVPPPPQPQEPAAQPKGETYKLLSANSSHQLQLRQGRAGMVRHPQHLQPLPHQERGLHRQHRAISSTTISPPTGRMNTWSPPSSPPTASDGARASRSPATSIPGVRIKDTQGFPTGRFGTTPWSADMNYNFDFTSTRVGGDDAGDWEHLRRQRAPSSAPAPIAPTAASSSTPLRAGR